MKMLLLLAACLACFAQDPQAPVFNKFSPTVIGVTFGPNSTYPHCYFWSVVPAPWKVEAACYSNGIAGTVDASTLQPQGNSERPSMVGSAPFSGVLITWIFTPNANAGIDYQITASFADGAGEQMWKGAF